MLLRPLCELYCSAGFSPFYGWEFILYIVFSAQWQHWLCIEILPSSAAAMYLPVLTIFSPFNAVGLYVPYRSSVDTKGNGPSKFLAPWKKELGFCRSSQRNSIFCSLSETLDPCWSAFFISSALVGSGVFFSAYIACGNQIGSSIHLQLPNFGGL